MKLEIIQKGDRFFLKTKLLGFIPWYSGWFWARRWRGYSRQKIAEEFATEIISEQNFKQSPEKVIKVLGNENINCKN